MLALGGHTARLRLGLGLVIGLEAGLGFRARAGVAVRML